MTIDSDDPIKCQIERLNYQIEMAKLYAQWWIARAVTGEAKNRDIQTLHGNRQLTDEEKIKDALNTANTHIHRIEELSEKKIEIMLEQMNQ